MALSKPNFDRAHQNFEALCIFYHCSSENLVFLLQGLLLPVLLAALLCLGTSRIDLVFDGACPLCRRTAAVVRALDWSRRIRLLNLLDWNVVSRLHPELDAERCRIDMHAVDEKNRVTAGFDAYRVLAWRLPLVIPFAALLYFPPVAALGRSLYRRVADSRARVPCTDDVCAVPAAKAKAKAKEQEKVDS